MRTVKFAAVLSVFVVFFFSGSLMAQQMPNPTAQYDLAAAKQVA